MAVEGYAMLKDVNVSIVVVVFVEHTAEDEDAKFLVARRRPVNMDCVLLIIVKQINSKLL